MSRVWPVNTLFQTFSILAPTPFPDDKFRLSGKRGVRSAECGVWKMRSVENAECGKCGVWKMRSVENAECGKCGV